MSNYWYYAAIAARMQIRHARCSSRGKGTFPIFFIFSDFSIFRKTAILAANFGLATCGLREPHGQDSGEPLAEF